MTSREVVAAVRLAAGAATGIARRVQEVHSAVAGRAFGLSERLTGTAAAPVREMHDAISASVYTPIRAGLRAADLAAAVADEAMGRAAAGQARGQARGQATGQRSLADHPRLRTAMALVNGWAGDRLEATGNVLATQLSVRVDGRRVGDDAASLAQAFPAATGRIAVFVHGLVDTERSWTPEGRRSFADGLAADFTVTPVMIRYNTGLHISQNGRLLHGLLRRLVANWPAEVSDVLLIGHSMGGLVARSALHQGMDDAWFSRVRAVITLGSPHLGAPLERAVNEVEHGMRTWPETAPFATMLRERSNGIQDLRFGNLVDADWADHDPGQRRNRRTHVPLPDEPPHFLIYATLGRRDDGVLSETVGDLLVGPASATGRGRHHPPWDVEGSRVRHFGRMHHFRLMYDPEVYAQVRLWVAGVLA